MRGGDELMIWQEKIMSSWGQVYTSFASVVPVILGAILTFTLGLVLSGWVRTGLVKLFGMLKVDEFSKRSGTDKFLRNTDVKFTLTELLAETGKWLVILTFFLATMDILGLSSVSQVLRGVLGYVPNVFAAAIIFAGGYYVAKLVETLVKGAVLPLDKKTAGPVSRFSRWFIVVISFFAAIDQLQVAKSLVNTFFQGLTYTLVLVVGLSVGLGSKDLVGKVLEDWYKKIKS